MTKFNLTFIAFCFLIISCKDNNEKGKIERIVALPTIPKDKDEIFCNCFDGIGSSKGDTAIVEMTFSNGESISVCGFVDKQMEGITISEFNVFECKTGKSLTEYDAMQICKIVEKKDTLIIQELKYLPTGKNWSWNLIQLGEQIITLNNGKLFISDISPKLEKFHIDERDAELFLNSLTRGTGYSSEWELQIGQLEVLALLGNKKATDILKNYEKFTGQETDGAVSETWKAATATVEWIKR